MKKRRTFLTALVVAANCGLCVAQSGEGVSATKSEKKITLSGYVQAQYQYGEEDASLKVGGENANKEESFSRIGIRRGFLKVSYQEGIASGVLQLGITEKGVSVKDAYLKIKEPWTGYASLQAGLFFRPFGYEIGYSSSKRESPERSTIIQTLFPDERDMGAMLTLQTPTDSKINFPAQFTLQAGLFAGNGLHAETDNRRDFIGHLSAQKKINKNIHIGLGVSYYNGSVYQGSSKVYTMHGDAFVADDNAENVGEYAKREYVGADVQFGWKKSWGDTQLNIEYLQGRQPGSQTSSKSPAAATLPTTDTYIRSCRGGYAMLVQGLGKLPLKAALKYDFYDPNTDLKKDEIGLNGSGSADITQDTYGAGCIWDINTALQLTGWYEWCVNEKTANLAEYECDRKDNRFTLRLQYKF